MSVYTSQYTGSQIDAAISAAYGVETKTSGMTQAVGKDANGKLWTSPGSETWEQIFTDTTTADVSNYSYTFDSTTSVWRKIYVEVEVGQSSASENYILRVYSDYIILSFVNAINKSWVSCVEFTMEKRGNGVMAMGGYHTNSFGNQANVLSGTRPNLRGLGTVALYPSAGTIPAGTKVTCWGVRN